MKQVYELFNKKYDKKLIEDKEYRKVWKKRKQRLETCGIKIKDMDDAAMLYYELIAYSIDIKERFEEVFFDTYVRMYDYWYDLTYQERKKQMNLDIVRLKHELPCFVWDGQEIYMPCFHTKFNHLYTDEIILLDLKQYHTFIRSYQNQLKSDLYGSMPYGLGWTSAICVAQDGDCFVLYHEGSHRFYRYTSKGYEKCLSLPPKKEVTQGLKQELAKAFLQDDEGVLSEILLKSELLNKRMQRKLIKLMKKQAKRMKKKKQKQG